jgi:diacylglycerol kinase (ATP)
LKTKATLGKSITGTISTAMKPKNNGIKRIIYATKYSFQGIHAAYRFEAAFRQELFLCAVFIPIILYSPLETLEKIWMIGSLFLLLIVELLNSAIEAVVDRISSEHHALSGRAKDMASAAILMTMLMIAITWSMILWQPLLTYYQAFTS